MSYVERSISFFQAQDFNGECELIIFNTDVDYPIEIINKPDNITIINNNIDYLTSSPYTNIGAIRRDAVTHGRYDYFITWDDDDIYLPWALQQRFDNITSIGKKAWKPAQSFFMNGQGLITLARNTFEASCILEIKEATFALETGSEAVGKEGWYIRLRDSKELNENSPSLPDYGFEWFDHFNLQPHRQSGDINNPENFNNHKNSTTDHHTRPIQFIDVSRYYEPYYKWFEEYGNILNQEYLQRYYKQEKPVETGH